MSNVTLTEVNSTGNILYEMYLPATMNTYRAFRYDWYPLVGIEPVKNKIPNEYKLSQNYPNPFNPNTIIRFQIKDSRHGGSLTDVKLIVYDALGKEVEMLVNEKLAAGTYEITFSGAGFPSGVYYYKLMSGNYSEVKKMVLVK